jgi:hypothetical protein
MAGTREIWRWKFRAAVWGAPYHAKARDGLLEMLRLDYPLFAEDKAALADYIEELTRKRTTKDRGKRTTRIGYEIDCYRRAVRDVSERSNHFVLTKREAIDAMCAIWDRLRMDWTRKYRSRLMAEFKVTEKASEELS